MTDEDLRQILSRLSNDEFFDRQAELGEVYSLAKSRSRNGGAGEPSLQNHPDPDHARLLGPAHGLLLGAPRVGKTEILRKCFDRLFNEGGDVAPIYYAFRPYQDNVERFSRDFLSQFLSQFIAFRRNDARLIAAADEPLAAIARAAPPEDYVWVRSAVDAFSRALQSGDSSLAARCALSAPINAALRAQVAPFIFIDNFHLIADESHRGLRTEILRALTAMEAVTGRRAAPGPPAPGLLLCGLRRSLLGAIPPDEEVFDRLKLIRIETMSEEPLEKMILSFAGKLGIEISDSTTELMIQQLNRDLFYIRALLDSAAARGSGLKTFMDFERVYTEEVLNGRISHYMGALLRDVAADPRAGRAVLEALALALDARGPVPMEAVIERMEEFTADPQSLLARLHARELLEINYGFVSGMGDPVVADYVRARYRSEIAGARRPVAGQELLGEKLKDSYKLMMSRYNRTVEAQLIESLSRFDFQSVPQSLLDYTSFDKLYRGMSRVQVRRALDEEQERARLPQIVLVNDVGSGEQPGISWRLFAASGFEGGIYSEANEVLWLIALVNSKEPLDLETLGRIDQRLESASRSAVDRAGHFSRTLRWYISKEGFSAIATEMLSSLHAYISDYAQLDLVCDYLGRLSAGESERGPASEFELVIPIEDDAELIAARMVEQVARAADFDQESINQIKTALIEACINAAEHSDSPDRRIYQKFALTDDRLVVTVSNKGRSFNSFDSEPVARAGASLKGTRGRGLHIIRTLMDEVRFERTDDGTSLVMSKFLKRPKINEL